MQRPARSWRPPTGGWRSSSPRRPRRSGREWPTPGAGRSRARTRSPERRAGRSGGGSRPAPAGLGPLEQVLHAAEGVGDAVLAAVADEQDVGVLERAPAAHTAAEALPGVAGAQDGARLPVRALDRPRDDVLEPAEDRAPLAGGFGHAEALVLADLDPAPAARQPLHAAARVS